MVRLGHAVSLEWDAAVVCMTLAPRDGGCLGFGRDQFVQCRDEVAQAADGAQVSPELAPVRCNAVPDFMDRWPEALFVDQLRDRARDRGSRRSKIVFIIKPKFFEPPC